MTKVIRTTPIDRSKRTALKGDIVGTVNIIHGKRKRRLSSNTFNEDYLVSSPRTPKKKSEQKKSAKKKQQKEVSESSEEEEEEEEIVIPLSGNRNKFKIVDANEDDEEGEPEEELETELFSQELKETKKKNSSSTSSTSSSNISMNSMIRISDGSELLAIRLKPNLFFSSKIIKHVKRLGGEFSQTFDSTIPITIQSTTIFSPEPLRVFTSIQWGGRQFKSSLIPEISGLKFEVFVIEEVANFQFLQDNINRIVLIGDATDCVLGVDGYYSTTSLEDNGDFWIYIVIDAKRKDQPQMIRLSSLLESLTIDETDYSDIVEMEFTQK